MHSSASSDKLLPDKFRNISLGFHFAKKDFSHSQASDVTNAAAHRTSLIAHRSPLTAHRSPLTTHYSPLPFLIINPTCCVARSSGGMA
ncbi:MAG: hypothetical protein EOM83_13885 [Clostridia bacterium]|nr:hypothetical protein [Clostridia bacterium]